MVMSLEFMTTEKELILKNYKCEIIISNNRVLDIDNRYLEISALIIIII